MSVWQELTLEYEDDNDMKQKWGGRGRNRGDNKSEMHIPKKLAFPCTEGAGVL